MWSLGCNGDDGAVQRSAVSAGLQFYNLDDRWRTMWDRDSLSNILGHRIVWNANGHHCATATSSLLWHWNYQHILRRNRDSIRLHEGIGL